MARTKDKVINNSNCGQSNGQTIDNSYNQTIDDNNDNDIEVMDEDMSSKSGSKMSVTSDQSLTSNETKRSSKDSNCDQLNEIKVYFLETKPFNSQSNQTIGRQPKTMQMAFTSFKAYKFNTNWIKEEEVVDNSSVFSSDKRIFILDSFDGSIYEYLLSKNVRIIGPLTVLYCFGAQCLKPFRNIPEKPIPVFSQCMRKLFVCISGFVGQKKLDLISKIEKMCGNFTKDLTKSVTHLVTDSVRTKKYKVAKMRGTAVLSSAWVEDCWTVHQHDLLCAADPKIVDKYRLKMFNNLMITVSQVDIEERDNVLKIVNSNGGEYSPSLKLTANNCLLLLREPSGDKFKYASMKRIPCLDIKWLYDSLKKGFALSEEEYIIRNTTSQKVQTSQRSESNVINNELNPNKDNISSTKIIQSLDNKLESSSTSNTSSNSCVSLTDNTSEDIIKKIENLLKDRKDEPFLEGCDIYVVGFNRPVFECIKSALISSGSVVYNEFKNLVTHVIVGPNTTEAEKDQLFADKTSKLVTIDWFLESLNQSECCDCSKFEVKNGKQMEENTSKPSQSQCKKPKDIFDGPLTVLCPRPARPALRKFAEQSIPDLKNNHKSLGDHMNHKNSVEWNDESSDDSSSQDSKHSIETTDRKSENKKQQKRKSRKESTEKTEVIDVHMKGESEEESVDKMPKKGFLFSGYDESTKAELKEIVQKLNGFVFDINCVTDSVTHLVIRDPSATEKTLSAIASGIWVLKEDYLYESRDKGIFVEEIPFEWGFQLSNETDVKSVRKRLMISAINWRQYLTKESEKAINSCKPKPMKVFNDWKVLVIFETKSTIPYTQVLKCGNAEVVVMTRDLDETQLNCFKYAFIDDKSIKDMPKYAIRIAKKFLKQQNLLKIDFISHYILNGPKADPINAIKKTLVKESVFESNQKRLRDDSEDTNPSKYRK